MVDFLHGAQDCGDGITAFAICQDKLTNSTFANNKKGSGFEVRDEIVLPLEKKSHKRRKYWLSLQEAETRA